MAGADGATVGVNGGIGKSLNPLKRFLAEECAGEIAGAFFVSRRGVSGLFQWDDRAFCPVDRMSVARQFIAWNASNRESIP